MSRSAADTAPALPGLSIDPAQPGERALLENLAQLYLHDFSGLYADSAILDLGGDGRFVLDPPLDRRWIDGDDLLLLRWHGAPAGFAIVNSVSKMAAPVDRAIAEFFVVRKHRRRGIGIAAAQAIFARWPGAWETAIIRPNSDGAAFWDRAIRTAPGADAITLHDRNDAAWNGPIYRFRIDGRTTLG